MNLECNAHLDLHQMRLLLVKGQLLDLSVSQDADHAAVLLQLLQLSLNLLLAISVLLGILGESLLLGLGPVLVEAALDRVVQVLRPHGVERAQAARGLDVANNADHDHRRGLDNCDGLAGLFLVQLGAGLLDLTKDVRRA